MEGTKHKIYIGKIPSDVDEKTLSDVIQQFVGVIPINIQLKRGFAFAELPNSESVFKAVEMLNGYNVMGSNLLVEPSMAENRRYRSNVIHVDNIPEDYPWEEMTRLLTTFGNVEHCEKSPPKTNFLSATVTYETPDQAQQAHIQLNNFEIVPEVFLKVDFVLNQRLRGRANSRCNQMTQPFIYPPPGPRPSFRASDFPLRMLVLSDMVGAIIGKGGGTIRQITQQSKARVDVHRKENAGSSEKVITVYGTPQSCSTACLKILDVILQESINQGRGELPLKILAHNNLIGRIIGKNGTTIKRIMEQSETKVTVSSSIHEVNNFSMERIISVKGKLENIGKAEQMISAKLRQSFESDMVAMSSQQVMFPGVHPMAMMSTIGAPAYSPIRQGPPMPTYMYGGPYMPFPNASVPPVPDLHKETAFVFIPNSSVGAIIGTGGSTIREMISTSGASIKVAQVSKEEVFDKSGERRVTVIGTPESQWKAQFMIFKKVSYEGFSASPECLLKVEILIPSSYVGRIIGKGGQTVKELQRLTHAVIKFPECNVNSELEEAPVQITGDFYSCQAAQRQIRSLIVKSNMSNQRRRMPSPEQTASD